MKDVATEAGVSLKTVSRVVNGEPGVAPLTEQRVREAIETLGFRRNDSARLLRTGQAATVGLVMEDIGDPFYSALLRGVESVARARGSLVLSGSSEADAGTEHELALALCARRVDGLIMIPTSDDHSYLLSEMRAGVPVVFADRPPGRIAADTVLSDNVGGATEGDRSPHRRRPPQDRIPRRQPRHLHGAGTAPGIPRGDDWCGRAGRGGMDRHGPACQRARVGGPGTDARGSRAGYGD